MKTLKITIGSALIIAAPWVGCLLTHLFPLRSDFNFAAFTTGCFTFLAGVALIIATIFKELK